jgi:hypothetical protein
MAADYSDPKLPEVYDQNWRVNSLFCREGLLPIRPRVLRDLLLRRGECSYSQDCLDSLLLACRARIAWSGRCMELFPAPDTAEKLSKDIVGALMVYCYRFAGGGAPRLLGR